MKQWCKKEVLAAVLAVVLFSCSQVAQMTEKKAASQQAGEPGAIVVEAITASATVEAIDTTKRTVMLKMPDGATKALKCGPEVRNFDQIKVGDQVQATVVDEVAVFMRKADAPPSAGVMDTVAVAPKGAKPGVLMVSTMEVTAKIEAVDAEKNEVTFLNPAGSIKTVKVGANVKNLQEFKKGNTVVIRSTEALLIDVVTPKK